MSISKFPKEEKSQEIGQHALIACNASTPWGWRLHPTDGDDDVGLDYRVQVVVQKEYKHLFHAQVKGSALTGDKSHFNAEREFISVSLEDKTINYYGQILDEVMLVFADLAENDDPRECTVYYKFIKDEVDEIIQNGELKEKSSHTFRIPTTNVISKDLDIVSILQSRIDRAQSYGSLHNEIKRHTDDPNRAASLLVERISRSPSIVNQLINTVDTPWVTPQKGTHTEKLQKLDALLQSSNLIKAESLLADLFSSDFDGTRHELSELHFLRGRYYQNMGLTPEALEDFRIAEETTPDIPRYKINRIHESILLNQNNANALKTIRDELDLEDEKVYSGLRVAVRVLLEEFDDAESIIDSSDNESLYIEEANLYIHKGDYKKCISLCTLRLNDTNLTDELRLTLLTLRAHSFYSIGIPYQELDSKSIPAVGVPSFNIDLLLKSWSDFKDAWAIARSLKYPKRSVDSLLSESTSLSLYFEDTTQIHTDLNELIKHRQDDAVVGALLHIAMSRNDSESLEIVRKIDSDMDLLSLSEKLYLLQRSRNFRQAISLTIANLTDITDSQEDWVDNILLGTAIQAHRLAESEANTTILQSIEKRDAAVSIKAVYEYVIEVENDPTAHSEAISKLWDHYNDSDKSAFIQSRLMHVLRCDGEDSLKFIEVAESYSKTYDLSLDESINFCHCLCLNNRHSDALDVIDYALIKHSQCDELKYLKALALDQNGDTPSALAILQPIVSKSGFDASLFRLYADIAGRIGLHQNAISIYEKIQENAHTNKEKLHATHVLLTLEKTLNGPSGKFVDLWEKFGELVDPNNEAEEAEFLTLYLVVCSHPGGIEEKHVVTYKERQKAFSEKFPESLKFQMIEFDESSPEDFFKNLEKLSGQTEEQVLARRKIQTLIETGALNLPYTMRVNFIPVPDYLYLWEISKNAKLGKEYLLLRTNESGSIAQSSFDFANEHVLFDDTSILVLFELGLLEKTLESVRGAAITRETIHRLNELSASFIKSDYNQKATDILSIIGRSSYKIQQPAVGMEDDANEISMFMSTIKAVSENGYLYCSDDYIVRTWATHLETGIKTCNTLNIIDWMVDTKLLDAKFRSASKQKLCSWNILGVNISSLDIFLVLQGKLDKNLSIPTIVGKLENDVDVVRLLDYVWDYGVSYEHANVIIADIVHLAVTKRDGAEIDRNIVAALWVIYIRKIQFHTDHRMTLEELLGDSLVVVSRNFAGDHEGIATLIWSIYNDVVELILENANDSTIEAAMADRVVQRLFYLDEDKHNKAYEFLVAGLTEGTAERSRFSEIYTEARTENMTRAMHNKTAH